MSEYNELIERASYSLHQRTPFAYTTSDQESYALPPLIRDLRDAIIKQTTIIERLTTRLEAFDEVMNNSAGVAGWHRNGDIASWVELNIPAEGD